MLIVDGMHFAKELDDMPTLNDPMSALAFAAHPFFGSAAAADSDSTTWPTFFGDASAQVPVIVTAWNTNNGACELYYPSLSKTLLGYLTSKRIGLVAIDFDVLATIVNDFNGTPNYFDSSWSCTGQEKRRPARAQDSWSASSTDRRRASQSTGAALQIRERSSWSVF